MQYFQCELLLLVIEQYFHSVYEYCYWYCSIFSHDEYLAVQYFQYILVLFRILEPVVIMQYVYGVYEYFQ